MKSAPKFGQERMVALLLCLLLGQGAPIQFRAWSAPEGHPGMGSGAASVPAKDYSGQILERAKPGAEREKPRGAEHAQFLAATATVAAPEADWQTLVVQQPIRTPQSCDFHTPPGRAPPVVSFS